MGQAFKFTFKILRNTKGFISSMVIMPVIMILLVSMTLAYSDVPVVGYIGEKAPSVAKVKMLKLEADEKDYFLGLSQGTLVIKTDKEGDVLQYYSAVSNNPLIEMIENSNSTNENFNEKPKLSYSIGIILFKLLTAAGLLATVLISEKGNGIILRVKNSKTKLSSYILGKSLAIIFVYEIANLLILLFYKFAEFDLGKSNILQLGILFTVTLFISTGLYIFLSAIMKNEGYIWTISTGIIFPLGLFSGILFPIEYMADWMKLVAHISPLYYLQNSVINGKIDTVPILLMCIFSAMFGMYGIRLLSKQR
ncbi:TPA: ABC transporter permease [Streptococcus equi subsp. zooepidemicus]|uniref:ABC transporter permease n=1 Tax=Streptococcus equi TaxID=1336 RepID=UPI0013F5D584|nr:ABC transporter permease [Streptococcus equi]HEL0614621.1 ABC transporter permease [Streptococcus equi subsp. zooepidemicus]HEL1229786.1 ABC transporter permease [Streptococcus equi subsp. zooepidemicus]